MEFNEKLQGLRKRRGLTQEELAESIYVSRTAISKWESTRILRQRNWYKLFLSSSKVTMAI